MQNIVGIARGGGSSIVKVPGDVPPARVYFFGLLVQPRVYFLAILVELSLGKGMLFGNFVKEMSKFGNFCKKNVTF